MVGAAQGVLDIAENRIHPSKLGALDSGSPAAHHHRLMNAARGGDAMKASQAIVSVSAKIGCSAETLRKWIRRAEVDEGVRPGLTSAERERLKALERENRELRRANEILRKASAYFAQAELDRRPKR